MTDPKRPVRAMAEARGGAFRPVAPLSRPEFVALIAVMFATIAFSIDAMLPALPGIAADLTPDAVNRAQLVLTAFILGMGIGIFFAGPLSDTFGRKPVLTAGIGVYCLGAVLAASAQSIEMLLAARVIQGLGAAAPRIVSQAMIRDLYAGRAMAQLMSFVMMIFILIPAIAPYVGAAIAAQVGWRGVFGAFVVFGIFGALWMNLRQPETLPPEARRSLRPAALWSAAREVLGHGRVVIYIIVLTLGFGQMFGLLASIQQIYAESYDKGDSFPLWFMVMGLLSGLATVVNATLVMRLGMRRLAIAAFAGQTVISVVLLAAMQAGVIGTVPPFAVFFFWSVSVFFMAGLTFGNLNALALEPLGQIAGMASSVVGAISTVLAVAIAAPIGLMFDGTTRPLVVGTLICSALAWGLMRRTTE